MTNRLRIKITSAFFVMVIFSGCGNIKNPIDSVTESSSFMQPATAEYSKITAEEAYLIMSETENYILLDVRTDEEYNERHIKGAVLIPDYEITERAVSELPDKNALILVYCRSGRRSADAAKALIDLGYTDVHDFGGIIDWVYDVE